MSTALPESTAPVPVSGPPPGNVPGPETAHQPRQVPAARCGPTALLVVSFLPVAGAYGVHSWRVGVASLALLLVLAPLAATLTLATVARLVPALLGAVSLGWSAWLFSGGERGLSGAVQAATRVLVLVLPGVLLAGHLRASELGDQLAQWFRVPGRPVVAAMAALGRLESLVDQVRETFTVRRVRGLTASRSPVARARAAASVSFGLLVRSIRDAGRMAVAMEARGLASARRRSWAEPARWRSADSVLLAVGALSAAVPFLLSGLTDL